MIKKLALAILLLFVFMCAVGQDTLYKNTALLEWEAVTQYTDATPLLPTDTVEYEVYRSTYPVADRSAPDEFIGITSALNMMLTIPNDGYSHVYSIRSKVTTDEGQTVLFSFYNWSDLNGAATPNPFVYHAPQTKTPNFPMGLRTP
jgi:hypothetical protein